ncbi:MAG TPA: hypothetical protein VNA69_14075 [Thermoanaerobaculia bacterium]|nr:hypothetical protein [Thermoanaerobaculia bacterium]
MRRADRRSRTIARAAVALIALLLAACSETKLEETSPDGRYVAEVRAKKWVLDGPAESLWVGERDSIQRVRTLGEDSQWCNRIEWSEDSKSVTFHIEGTGNTATTYVSTMEGGPPVRR